MEERNKINTNFK